MVAQNTWQMVTNVIRNKKYILSFPSPTMAAIRHIWLFMFKFKPRCTSEYSVPILASGWHMGSHRYWTFPSPQKVPLGSSALDLLTYLYSYKSFNSKHNILKDSKISNVNIIRNIFKFYSSFIQYFIDNLYQERKIPRKNSRKHGWMKTSMSSYPLTVFLDNPTSKQCPGPLDQRSPTYNHSSPTIKRKG